MIRSLALLVAVACAEGAYDPPSLPPHDDAEEGYMHARGKERPFLCHDVASGAPVACPDDIRPEPLGLSCDAAGCHGNYGFSPTEAQDQRRLNGSDGPGCYTCHDQEWSPVKVP